MMERWTWDVERWDRMVEPQDGVPELPSKALGTSGNPGDQPSQLSYVIGKETETQGRSVSKGPEPGPG